MLYWAIARLFIFVGLAPVAQLFFKVQLPFKLLQAHALDGNAREFDSSRDLFFFSIRKFLAYLEYCLSAYLCRLSSAQMIFLDNLVSF